MTSSNTSSNLTAHAPHRFPWWLAPLLTSPARRLLDNPDTMLGNLVQPGHVVLEIGPGNGYFSVPIARALGPNGTLIAVDVEPRLLKMLSRRLTRRNLQHCLVPRLTQNVEQELDDLAGTVDRVVAINVIHELPKPRDTILALAAALKIGGQFLLIEPPGHVSRELFQAELAWAEEAELRPFPMHAPGRSRQLAVRFQKGSA